jgi:hypothetical protein
MSRPIFEVSWCDHDDGDGRGDERFFANLARARTFARSVAVHETRIAKGELVHGHEGLYEERETHWVGGLEATIQELLPSETLSPRRLLIGALNRESWVAARARIGKWVPAVGDRKSPAWEDEPDAA